MTNLEQVKKCGTVEEKVEMFVKLCEHFNTEMKKMKAMQDLIDSEYKELMQMVGEYND